MTVEKLALDRAHRLIRLESIVREFLNRDFTHMADTMQANFRTMTEAQRMLTDMAFAANAPLPRVIKI